MNILHFYDDDNNFLVSDSIETLKAIAEPTFHHILISDISGEVADIPNLHVIPYACNLAFPIKPAGGNNFFINTYADYCVANRHIVDMQHIKDALKKIYSTVGHDCCIEPSSYIDSVIPFHILYKYNNTERNSYIVNRYSNRRQVPEKYIYADNLFICGPYTFANNYEIDKRYISENEYWIYSRNMDKECIMQIDKCSKHRIVVDDDYLYVILTLAHGWYNMGEFLDSFQKLYYIEKLGLDKSKIKLVMHWRSRVVDMNSYLYNLGYNNSNFYLISNDSTCIFKKCLFIPPMCFPGQLTSFSYHWFIKNQLKDITATKPTRLYLDRNKYGKRITLNNTEVIDYLHTYNFLVLHGDESLATIITLFKHAEMIVGPHGSFFRNNIFCSSKTVLVEFCSKNRKNYAQFQLSMTANSVYYHILSECNENHDITIDMPTLKSIVERVLPPPSE